MKKFLLLLFTCIAVCGYAQQNIILYYENFETPDNSINLTTGGIGTMTGSNTWIIDSSYSGLGIYPNTTPEDSIVSGTITNEPHSTYLHIYDNTSTATNCNWNESNPSDHFCFLSSGFCSLGMDSVTFTFYWIAGGDSVSSYGQLYYSANGGPWLPTGRPKYYGQAEWLYETVTDPAFNNVQNLQFGFRWVNTVDPVTPDMSWGIDEILAIGTYENVTNPTHISITSLYPDTVCQNQYLSIQYTLSKPMCDGQYEIEILNSAGQLVNGPGLPTFTISAPDTTGYTAVQITSAMLGNCYHILLLRFSPAPMIIGDTSICFSAVDCPTSIFTYSAPVMTDGDTACVLSELDVYFYSFGTYTTGNVYTAQLSDSAGNFTTPYQLGTLGSTTSYQGPPGDVSGLIPANVPPGCNYYIRVISNHPYTVGSLIGPFCIKRCDMETNNITDLQYCIGWPNATDTNEFHIQINHWDSLAHYDTCNNFTIQLLDMMTFAVVNTGGLGIIHYNHSDSFALIVGPSATLPVAPGTYYLRILSNCSSDTNNQTGTVIRITIGDPNPIPPVITPEDTAICSDDLVSLYINPYNFNSQYQWLSPVLNNGLPFIWPSDPLLINFTGSPPGVTTYIVREINYGCPGPWSAKDTVNILVTPSSTISGPTTVCFGDTAIFYVGFQVATNWDWGTPPGVRKLNQGNNEISLLFDSVGTYTIGNKSTNRCGRDTQSYTFTVANLYNVQITPVQPSLCFGDSIHLTAGTAGVNRSLLTIDSSLTGYPGAFFNLVALDSLVIDSFACKILTTAGSQPTLNIYQRPGSYVGLEQTPSAWTQVGTAYPLLASPDQMITLPTELYLPMSPGDTFGFYIIDVDAPPVKIAYSPPGAPPVEGTVYASDGIVEYLQGAIGDQAAGNQPFGASLATKVWNGIVYYHTQAGLHFIWNTGDTTPTIRTSPSADSTYFVKMFDNSGCNAGDTTKIKVNPLPTLSLGPDTVLCENESYAIPGLASVPGILWTPDTGLSSTTIIAPTFKYGNADTIYYTVVALDTTGCTDTAHLRIAVMNCTSYIEVPEAFSPNGDGIDDYFTLFANNIASYDIRIYNRWGEKVYESSDMTQLAGAYSTAAKGWDGTYEGKPQNVGTFVYYLTATDIHGKTYNKKGNLTLLR